MGIWTYDVATKELFCDEKMLEIFRAEAFNGQLETFMDLIHSEDKEQALKSVSGYLKDETVFEYSLEYRLNAKSDEDVYVKSSALIEREHGLAKKVVGMVWDCTADKKAERYLKEKNERLLQLESFIDQSTDAIQVSDENGRLVYINDAAAQRLGIEKANVGNYHVGDFEPLFSNNQAWKAHLQDLKTNGFATVESVNLNQITKELFPVEVKITLQRINGQDYVIANSRDITKRKKAEDRLKASEEKFRFIAENTSDGIAIFENGEIIYSSHAYDIILGYTKEDGINYDLEFIYNSLHPEDREGTFQLINEAKESRVPSITYQFRARHKAGHYIWREDTANFFYSETGEMIKSILVARNITDRKNDEMALKESEAKHRFLIASSQEVICLHEPDGIYKFVSPSMTKLTGYTTEELIGIDPYTFVHPDDITRVSEDAHKPLLAGITTASIQYRFRKNDGSYLWFDTYIQPIKDENGKVISFLTGSRDITQLKNTEIMLAERKAFIENIANNIPGIILQYKQHKDGTDEFSYFNKEAEKIWQLEADVLKNDIGKVWEHVHKDDVEELKRSYEMSKQNLSIWENEHRFVTPNGEMKWLSCIGVPHRDANGTTTWDNLIFDVTEKKKTQLELAKSEEMLSDIANSIPGVIWTFVRQPNGDDRLDFMSEGAKNIFEITKEEALSNIDAIWEMIHPDDIGRFTNSVDESARNLSPWKCELRIVMPDGRVKWLKAVGNPKKLEDGSIMWHSLALDITDKKTIELELEQTLRHLKLSIATGKMGIWEFNLMNGNLDWNDQMFEIFSVDKLSFDHSVETFNKCVHPDDLEFMTDIISKFPQNDQLADVQFRIINSDGEIRHILVSGNPSSYTTDGKIEKYIGINLDITHIVEYQEQLKATVQEKDALFKELHHRIKNNLQMVASLLFIKSTMTEEVSLKRFIDETSAKIHSISSIHEQLLQLKGVDKLDVKKYLDSLCVSLIQTYTFGGSKFDLALDIDSVYMNIDKVLNLGLIVNEIMSNTIKYAYPQSQSGKIYVALKNKSGMFELCVSDDGIGIPDAKIASMGNSYGMQLISIFTQQIKGNLKIENSNGTKFIINFPANE